MANGGRRPRATVLDLRDGVARRLKAMDQEIAATRQRLDETVDLLIRLVRVVAAQHQRVTRDVGQLGSRSDTLVRSVVTGRTADAKRLAAAERRLAALERRLARTDGTR